LRPSPHRTKSPDNGGTETPSDRSTPAVECTSADSRILLTRDSPVPSAPKMSARCEIDLSPGTRNEPDTLIEGASPASSRGLFSRPGISRSPAPGDRALDP